VLELKEKLDLFGSGGELPSEEEAKDVTDRNRYRSTAETLGALSPTLVQDRDQLLPIAPGKKKVLIITLPIESPKIPGGLQVAEQETDSPTSSLETAFKELGVEAVTVDSTEGYEEHIQDASTKIYLINARTHASRGNIRLSYPALQLIERTRTPKVPQIFISQGNPYALRELPYISTYICSYSSNPAIAKGLAERLLGHKPFEGQLPVEIPSHEARRC
jgi:beta-N-acetylhexosaminidase